MSKIFFSVGLLFLVSNGVFSMDNDGLEPFVIQFSAKPNQQVRKEMKDLGFVWWNSFRTEWAGLSEEKKLGKSLASWEENYEIEIIVNHYKEPVFLLKFSGTPEKGNLRNALKTLDFSWWNHNTHEWFGFPKVDKSEIEKTLQRYTKVLFEVKEIQSDIKNLDSITESTKASSDDDADKEDKIQFFTVDSPNLLVMNQEEDTDTVVKMLKQLTTIGNPTHSTKNQEKVKTAKVFAQPEGSKIEANLKDNFESEYEKNLYQLSQRLSDEIDLSLAVESTKENKLKAKHFYLNVKKWDPEIRGCIEDQIKMIPRLIVFTKTPETVLPWIIQFDKLEALYIKGVKEDYLSVKIDDIENTLISTSFPNLRVVELPEGLYKENDSIQHLVNKLFTKLQTTKQLKNVQIKEGINILHSEIYRTITNQN